MNPLLIESFEYLKNQPFLFFSMVFFGFFYIWYRLEGNKVFRKKYINHEFAETIAEASFNKGYALARHNQDVSLLPEHLEILKNSPELMNIYLDQYISGFKAGFADKRN